jgi:hypothetical protein
MRAAALKTVPALALVLSSLGCNAILDIRAFPAGDTADATTDANLPDGSGDADSADAPGPVPEAGDVISDAADVFIPGVVDATDAPLDSGAPDAVHAADAGDGSTLDASQDSMEAAAQCSPATARCLDNTPQTCGADDQWHSAPNGACVGSEPLCLGGTCVACAPNLTPTRCTSDGIPQFCATNGQWQNVASGACSGSTPICVNGVCSGCTGQPDGTRCGAGLACEGGACTCNAASCPAGCCAGGACMPKPTWYQDADGDGFGNRSVSMASCAQPTGFVSDSTDCCDMDPLANPSFFANHSSNPWQIAPDACGNFLWNCEASGVPVKQFTNLSLCTTSYCIGSCPNGCLGYTESNPACGQTFIQETVMCDQSSGTCAASSVMSTDSLQQGCY